MTFDTSRPTDADVARGPGTVADLVSAIPYLLGFYPKDSLVLLGTASPGQPGVDFTVRVDLPPPSAVADAAGDLARLLRNHRCEQVLVAVIGGLGPPGGARLADPVSGPPRPEVAAEVLEACRVAGIHVCAVVWVAELAADAPWRCYGECGCAGSLPDPLSSPAAAAAVAAGQVTYADRADLEAMVAAGDPSVLRRRAALLEHGLAALTQSERRPRGGPARLATVRRWVERARVDRPALDDDDVVGLCLALTDPLVRDAAFGFALAEATAAAAERLWATLVTEAPDPVAAEPAVLLAHSALVRGDGALAGMALARAQQAWPGHRLSALFQAALEAGCRPEQLRNWLVTGCQDATDQLVWRGEHR
jgi:hypothetical protein